MNTRLGWRLACLLVLLLQGCGTPRPELLGQRYFVTHLDTYPVLISSVDGKSSVNMPVLVDPGLRRIVVQGPPGGSGVTELEVFMLDVKPCTRYYIVAHKANRLDSRFTPKVDYQEALPGCTPPAP